MNQILGRLALEYLSPGALVVLALVVLAVVLSLDDADEQPDE